MITIQPYATVKGMQRALGNAPGVTIPIKYIRVGKGLQQIQLDDAGRSTTETLAAPVDYLEILYARKITPYQWQMVIDVKTAHSGVDFNFSEFTLCDVDQQTIAIYGHPTQALYAVTAVLDNALLAVNLVLATLPANSIEIIHHNLPLEMFLTKELAAMNAAIGAMSWHFIQQNRDFLQSEQQRTATNTAQTSINDSVELRLIALERRCASLELELAQHRTTDLTHAAALNRAVGDLTQIYH